MKKLIAVIIFTLTLTGTVYASVWDDVTGYASGAWDYVTGFFTGDSKDKEVKKNEDTLPDYIASDWKELSENLTDALALREKNETLPDKTWLPFTEDKESNSAKINALLDRALIILSDSGAGNARRKAIQLKAKINSLRSEIDTMRNQRINAPESTYLFWRLTKGKADGKIAELENELSRTEAELKSLTSRLTAELKATGLELTSSQADILLNSVTGDDILNNTIIFDNVKAVVTKLEELSQNDTNTLDITRRYTGMYLVLNDILIHTQEELIKRINSEYKPRLQEIIREADAVRKEALSRSNSKDYTPEQRRAFAMNAKSNSATIDAAKLYGEYLDSQRLAVMDTVNRLKKSRDLAENTYKTVRSSGELRGLIHSGLNIFDSIGSLTMPDLKMFEGGAMRQEFDEINRRLKK